MGSAAGCGGMTALLEAIVLSSNMKNCDRKKDLISTVLDWIGIFVKVNKTVFFSIPELVSSQPLSIFLSRAVDPHSLSAAGSSCFFYADSDPAKKIVKISYELSVVEKNNNKTG